MRGFTLAALVFVCVAPAKAEVIARADSGFVVHHVAEVTASSGDAWKALVDPAAWWNAEHTFSSDSHNLSIDARPGGCFCEVLPGEDGAKAPRGGVEHMRVVFVEQDKVLRMVGALGPLQSEAVQATLTITLKPIDGGTRLTWEYIVGGFMRYKQDLIAPAVDKIIGEQLTRLAEKLGSKASPTNPQPQPGMESGR
jgi:hypothetical protein